MRTIDGSATFKCPSDASGLPGTRETPVLSTDTSPMSRFVDAKGLQVLKRVSWRSVLQVVLLLVAMSVLVNKFAGLDLDDLTSQLGEASWLLVAAGVAVAQTPRFAQAVSTLGASPKPLPVRDIYMLQLAQSYVGLAVPSSAARIAMDVRFFQKHGFSSGAALAIGGVDSLGGFITEATLLLSLLIFTPKGLYFDLDASSLPEWRTIIGILLLLAILIWIVSLLLPDRRRQFMDWASNLITDGKSTLRNLNSPRRLVMLFGGNLASILLFASTLGIFGSAFGTTVSFSDLIVIIISVSLLAGLLPVPGGIGVVESGLTFGLVAAGMAEGPAFAAVIIYRIATFYLPPLWGFLAFRRLQQEGLL